MHVHKAPADGHKKISDNPGYLLGCILFCALVETAWGLISRCFEDDFFVPCQTTKQQTIPLVTFSPPPVGWTPVSEGIRAGMSTHLVCRRTQRTSSSWCTAATQPPTIALGRCLLPLPLTPWPPNGHWHQDLPFTLAGLWDPRRVGRLKRNSAQSINHLEQSAENLGESKNEVCRSLRLFLFQTYCA